MRASFPRSPRIVLTQAWKAIIAPLSHLHPVRGPCWQATMNTEQYARWFRASTPYIRAHQGRTFVVILNGEAILHGNLINIVHDLALLHVLGARLVVVHGARPQIDQALPKGVFHTHRGISRRITDQETMRAIAGVHGGLRVELEALFSTGLPTSPLHNTEIQLVTGNFVIAKPIGVLDGVDHELAGQPRRIRANGIRRSLDAGAIVLLSPMGYSPSGQAFNLAADELAEQVAIALGADKFIAFDELPFLADTRGGRLANLAPEQLGELFGQRANESIGQPKKPEADARNPGTAGATSETVVDQSSTGDVAGRTGASTVEPVNALPVGETTRRNLRALLGAVRGGVPSGQLVSYRDDGALLAELFTAEGVGTQVTLEDRRVVRRASTGDLADIVEIIRPLEESGRLVKRTRDRLERELDCFFVAEVDGVVAGCCALLPAGKDAELACVAVHPAHRDGASGIGRKLLAAAETAARAGGFEALFALTTQARDWFVENGFQEADSDRLPRRKQELTGLERNSKVLIKMLSP